MVAVYQNKQHIEHLVYDLLAAIGEDPERAGLKGTPDRIARMLQELCRGYDLGAKPKITTFDNGLDGIHYDSMVIDRGRYYSLCEHHMMPFFGRYVFAYIPNPNGKIIGLSKIGRVVDWCAARLQIQERLVADVVKEISDALGDENPPLGIALYMEGEHLCKTMRGAKKEGTMSCCHLTGIFREDGQARAEFLATCKETR